MHRRISSDMPVCLKLLVPPLLSLTEVYHLRTVICSVCFLSLDAMQYSVLLFSLLYFSCYYFYLKFSSLLISMMQSVFFFSLLLLLLPSFLGFPPVMNKAALIVNRRLLTAPFHSSGFTLYLGRISLQHISASGLTLSSRPYIPYTPDLVLACLHIPGRPS